MAGEGWGSLCLHWENFWYLRLNNLKSRLKPLSGSSVVRWAVSGTRGASTQCHCHQTLAGSACLSGTAGARLDSCWKLRPIELEQLWHDDFFRFFFSSSAISCPFSVQFFLSAFLPLFNTQASTTAPSDETPSLGSITLVTRTRADV